MEKRRRGSKAPGPRVLPAAPPRGRRDGRWNGGVLREIVSTFAHELNQPLSAALSYVQTAGNLLAEGGQRRGNGHDNSGSGRPSVADLLGAAEIQIMRASAVVNAMRALLRKEPPRLAPTDLAEIVHGSVGLALRDLRDAGIECVVHAGTAHPQVRADGAQLEQVMLCLLHNAIDAIDACDPPRVPPHRRIEITIGEAGGDAYSPRDAVSVAVRDSGKGIAPEILNWLFTPFFTTKDGGMGFGLKISRTIIESFGGEIALGNAPGGAIASIRLPVWIAALPPMQQREAT